VRDWLHVDDHCRGIQIVLDKGSPGEVYNIGGGTELTNGELTGLLLSAFGVGWEMVRQVPDRLGHDLRYSVDCVKLRDLGYEPRRAFAEGLSEVIRWYAGNESWWRPLRGGKA
jgi:dTDP-glucose 4,6-dehydratase